MKYLFMLPIVLADIAGIVAFILNHGALAEKNLAGLGYVGLGYLSLCVIGTIGQFIKGSWERTGQRPARTFSLYLLFLVVFLPACCGFLYLVRSIYVLLFPYIGGSAATVCGACYAVVLIGLTAIVWGVNDAVAPGSE